MYTRGCGCHPQVVRPTSALGDGPDMVRIAKIAAGVGLIVWALSGITYQPRRTS